MTLFEHMTILTSHSRRARNVSKHTCSITAALALCTTFPYDDSLQ